jgi:hypothetical protein
MTSLLPSEMFLIDGSVIPLDVTKDRKSADVLMR